MVQQADHLLCGRAAGLVQAVVDGRQLRVADGAVHTVVAADHSYILRDALAGDQQGVQPAYSGGVLGKHDGIGAWVLAQNAGGGKLAALDRTLGPVAALRQAAFLDGTAVAVQLVLLTLGLVVVYKGDVAPPGLGQPLYGVVGAVLLIGKDTVGIGQRQNRVSEQNRDVGDIFGDVLAALRRHEYRTNEKYTDDLLGIQRAQVIARAGKGAAQVAQNGAVPGGGHRALDLVGDGCVVNITDIHRHNGNAFTLAGSQPLCYPAGLIIIAVQHVLDFGAGGFANLAAVQHTGDSGNGNTGLPGYIVNGQVEPPVRCDKL